MATLDHDGVQLDYRVRGEGDPVVLICGCGQPAVSWELGVAPGLLDAGFSVVTFDNRGVPPSSSPPAPYTIDQMVDDTVALVDHLGLDAVRLAGYSMGGWIAESLCARVPERVSAAALIGSCNVSTSWEKSIGRVELELARSGVELPRLFYATETMRYLPNSALQDDGTVDAWLAMIGDLEVWPNPGREGQYAAAMDWVLDTGRTGVWPGLRVPVLVLAFEHDVDSPPARARAAAAEIPGARFVEIAGASHLGPMTHAAEVAAELVGFFR
ncbi:MAG TPA: alpha/beta fold hydrolase [Acidimicrobiales bacterium]|nr:alpha/beta fold hydrolase [Acidimicrobiales bacterium]